MRVRIIILVSIITHAIRARVYRGSKKTNTKKQTQKTKNAKPKKKQKH